MPLNKYTEYLEFARKISQKAGKILVDHQFNFAITNQKDIQDIATTADLASEKYLIKTILKTYPEHGIVSEEAGIINPTSEYKWIIDPLDGTKEYVRGIPLWNCSLALEHRSKLVLSIVYRALEKTLYSAILNGGSLKNNQKIKVSSVNLLANSFVYCYLPSFHRQKDSYDSAFEKLKKLGKHIYRLRSLADENTALCWLAQGGCEAYLNLSNLPKYHDIAPGLLIAGEAGAVIDTESYPVMACNNSKIYNEIIDIIK